MHSRKVPFQANGVHASTTDSGTWTSFERAFNTLQRLPGHFDGIGYVLGEGVAGIDLDHCLDKDGEPNRLAEEVLKRAPAGAYIEVSPSGQGLHLIVRCSSLERSLRTTLLDGKIEVYRDKRYFTITGDLWDDANLDPQLADGAELVEWIQEQARAKVAPLPVERREPTPAHSELERLLEHVDPSDDTTWLKVGMALKDAYGEGAWEIFDDWSQRTTQGNYDPRENRRRWESFGRSEGGVKVGLDSVRFLARQGGWSEAESLIEAFPSAEPSQPAQPPPKQLQGVDIERAFSTVPSPRKWVLGGFFERAKTGVLAASGGGSKTQFLLQLGISVCLGEMLGGVPTLPPEDAGSVLILATEDDGEEIERRLWGIHQLRHFSEAERALLTRRLQIIPMVGRTVQLLKQIDGNPEPIWEQVRTVVERAKSVERPRLIVLDPLARFLGGEEGSNQAGIRFVEMMEFMAKQTGAAVIASAHISKAALAKLDEGHELSQGDVRGASAIVFNTRATAFLTPPCPLKAKEKWCAEQDIEESLYDDILKLRLSKTNVSRIGSEAYFERVVIGESSVLTPFDYKRPAVAAKDQAAVTAEMHARRAKVLQAIAEVCDLKEAAVIRDIQLVTGIRTNMIMSICKSMVEEGLIERAMQGTKMRGYRVSVL